jgi:hypothetical protein
MKLSLAIVLFLVSAAPTSADAAPQAKAKKPQANKAVQMVTVSGECTKLVHAGQPIEGCKNILVNMSDSTRSTCITDHTLSLMAKTPAQGRGFRS